MVSRKCGWRPRPAFGSCERISASSGVQGITPSILARKCWRLGILRFEWYTTLANVYCSLSSHSDTKGSHQIRCRLPRSTA